MKKINIEYKTVRVPAKIEVDGVVYPIHQRNLDIVAEYSSTQNEAVLDKLLDFALIF